jgi:small subunit ribosomal protein S3
VSSIEVDRPGNKLRITIRTSRPGIIIGRKGAEIEKLKGDLAKKTNREVFIDIQEVHRPELDAQLVSESIALQLEKRVAFRRAMRKAVDSALRFGCKGIKVRVSGRLNGAEIARSEWYLQGQLPLHTLRADIDYGFSQSYTTYGVIGVKVWIYKGEVLEGGNRSRNTLRNDAEPRRRRGPRDDRGRDDRGDRGDRGGDRRPQMNAGAVGQSHAPYSAPPVADVTGPVVQAPPADLPKPASAPILPPMSAPVAPSWKQEQHKPADTVAADVVAADAVATDAVESSPVQPAVEQPQADTGTEAPKESGE